MQIPTTYQKVLKTEPYAHQFEAFEKFKDKEFFYLFFDMGTGKTKTAIDIASWKYVNQHIDAVLIIAPNNIHTQWIKEQYPAHCAVDYVPMVWQSNRLKQKLYLQKLEYFITAKINKLKVFAVNVEAFQSDSVLPYIGKYVKSNKVFIIEDESSRIKNPRAKRSMSIHRLNKYGARCILTGTPATKSPFDLWSQFEFLKANYFKCNYFMFQHRYGILMRAVNNRTGGMYTTVIDEKTFNIIKHRLKQARIDLELQEKGSIIPEYMYTQIAEMNGVTESNVRAIERAEHYVKYKNMDELKELIAHDGMSVTKQDCLDLPPKIYEVLPVEMPAEQLRIYKNLKEQLFAEYMEKELTVFNKLSLTLRLMQVCGGFFPFKEDEQSDIRPIGETNAKLERLLEDLEEVNFESTKVIVWAAFIPELKMLARELGKVYKCCLYFGEVDTITRDQIKKDFKDGKYDIFIGNTATAGFGLNLQNATLQYFFSNNFRVEDRLQAEDRSHRIGVVGSCVYKDIVMLGTIDEKVHRSIKSGRDLNDYFKDMSVQDILKDEEGE